MWGHYGDGGEWWMWILGSAMMLAFWGGLFGVFYTLTRRPGPESLPLDDSAEHILARRLAAGEIDEAAHERVLQRLRR